MTSSNDILGKGASAAAAVPVASNCGCASSVSSSAETGASPCNESIAMPVAEKFVSINGEGQCAGKLAAFIRFVGCNLRCSWCDTMWANGEIADGSLIAADTAGAVVSVSADCDAPAAVALDSGKVAGAKVSAAEDSLDEASFPIGETVRGVSASGYTTESVSDLLSWVRETGVECVTLTGGEPVLQPALPQFVRALLAEPGPSGRGLRVEIETNGSVDLAPLVQLRRATEGAYSGMLTFTVDWKLPVSGQEQAMLPDNFALLDMRDTVKFVCGSSADLLRMLEVARKLSLPGRVPVYLSPVFGSIEPAEIVSFVQEHKLTWATVQLQLHKLIWPNVERGV